MKRTSLYAGMLLLLAVFGVSHALATVTETVHVDLNALIDSAAHTSSRFAVNVPHTVSTDTQGQWSRNAGGSTWVYRATIPTAVSMSFHASDISLPPSAILTVNVGAASVKYVARDLNHGELWSRPLPGDTVLLSLSVSAAEEARARISIDSLQAGYRGLGGGVPDHPQYRRSIKARADSTQTCTENYSCNSTPANQGPANATVAVIVSNEYQCTGTLLNNTRGDGTPYVLTARHCQTGELGGGDPNAAAAVSIYWDAVTACGQTLGSIYSTATIGQTGAVTVVEQQDAWLIKLNLPPAAEDAYFAGWDATGAVFTGGYSIHHALGNDKQYVAWNGQAALEHLSAGTLKVGYDSTFWGLVNGLGNVGAGASGGAVFDANNNVVGSSSLAELVAGDNSAGKCPATPVPVPTANTATALYTALSAIWTSTADTTSSTGNTTLQSVLDPDNSAMVIAGLATLRITVNVDHASANTGDNVTLSWNEAGAQSCTASGGAAGDGWSGPKAPSGSISLTESAGGQVNYTLSCSIGNRVGYGNVFVNWNYIQPVINLSGPAAAIMIGGTAGLNWNSNVGPCTASGGTPGDGWAGSRATSANLVLVPTQIGAITYTLACGSGARATANSVVINVTPPTVTLYADATQLRAGESVNLTWFGTGVGGQCTPTGGSSGDGWIPFNPNISGNGGDRVTEATAGTYTYTITCTGGGRSASSSTTVTFTNDAPSISITALYPRQQVYPNDGTTPEVGPDLVWSSNVRGCFVTAIGPNGTFGPYMDGVYPTGFVADSQSIPGTYTYTLTCGSRSASATIDWVATPIPNALTTSKHKWAANIAYPLTWSTSTGPCIGSGGGAGDGWAGSKSLSGSQMVTETHPGTYTFTLTCGSGSTTTQSQQTVYVLQPFIQLYSIPGPPTTLYWSSTVGPCTYVDGSTGTGVPVSTAGNAPTTPAASGDFVYSITCGSGPSALYAATTIATNVPAAPTLAANKTEVSVNSAVTLTWTSSGQNMCYATGGTGTDPWSGSLGAGSGSLVVTSRSAGAVTYGMSCGNQKAQVVVTYDPIQATDAAAPTPSVNLTSSAATQAAGQNITLTWTSTNVSSCVAGGGAAGDGWSGDLATAGSMAVTEKSAAAVTYSITCSGAPPAATAQTTVTFAANNSPGGTGSGGSSGGGGGGAFSAFWLFLLSIPLAVRLARSMLIDHSRMGITY